MASLLLAMYWFIWAVCDLLKLPILRGTAKFAAPEKEKSYRTWRGILFLLFTAVSAAIFVAERIWLIRLNFGQALLFYGLPYTVILLGVFLLNHIYQIPPLWNRPSH